MIQALDNNAGAAGNPKENAFFGPCQWGLDGIDVAGAWFGDDDSDDDDDDEGQFGSSDVKVAVIDGGVDPLHQDLIGKIDTANSTTTISPFPDYDICERLFGVPDTSSFVDFNFHGTFVTAQIVSNGIGIAGIAPNSRVVMVKALNCAGFGATVDVDSAIVAAAQIPGVEVINMSLGRLIPNNPAFQPLIEATQAAIDFANDRGVLVVASAGNEGLDLDGSGLIHIPSMLNNVVSTSATDINDDLASYSNFGVTAADVAAPGGDFPYLGAPLPGCAVSPVVQQGLHISACSSQSVTLPFCATGNNFYIVNAGTSFAAPMTTGVAALAEAKLLDSNSGIGPAGLEALLTSTAEDLGVPGPDPIFSNGRINASSAVELADLFADEGDDDDDDDDE